MDPDEAVGGSSPRGQRVDVVFMTWMLVSRSSPDLCGYIKKLVLFW